MKGFIAAAFAIGVVFGYAYAHHYLALECQRLGGFFVGPSVYECAPANGPSLADGRRG
jgi:hypothetical protein